MNLRRFRGFPRRALPFVIATAVLAVGFVAWLVLADLPSPESLAARSSPSTTKILDRNGRLLYEVLDPRSGRRTRVRLDELPPHLVRAVIAVEDARFYENWGVDPAGVARAAWQSFRAGGIVSGASTITQQLARLLLMTPDERESRTALRKLREMTLAIRLNAIYEKDALLEMYLNEVYFGEMAYGVEAAAEAYFGKPASQVDLAEAALLAGLIQSPAAYDPLVYLDAARSRQQVVLGLMERQGVITPREAESARNEPLHFPGQASNELTAPHFVAYVRGLLESRYGAEAVNAGGLVVTTTLDLALQRAAETSVSQQLADLERRVKQQGEPDRNVHDAALVALEVSNGQVLAMVGSAKYADESIDGAVNVALALRQPGSSIKPLTYAAAFDRGLTPATVVADVPATFLTREGDLYSPLNHDQLWHGPISLRQALATSSNMAAVRVLDTIGVPALVETARALGISSFSDPDRFGLALTLGGGEVTLLELTAAYAGLARGGVAAAPVSVIAVRLPDGSVDRWQAPGRVAAVSPQAAYLVTDILADNLARMPAFGEDSPLQLYRPAAAKTGTTTDFRDNWTLGYTPDLAVGVWVGNADNQPMVRSSGITGAAPIWHSFMAAALASRQALTFARPQGLTQAQVCETSGLLATPDCGRTRWELFKAGTEPTEYDDTYQKVALDGSTGLRWKPGCPGPAVERVYLVLPPEARDWARGQGIAEPPPQFCDGSPAPAVGTGIVAAANSLPSAPAVVVAFPEQDSTFILSEQIPTQAQALEMIASARSDVRALAVIVDGEVLATAGGSPARGLWPLSPGFHTVWATGIGANGVVVESQRTRFQVVAAAAN
jgi:1A family penicillin-binding protein